MIYCKQSTNVNPLIEKPSIVSSDRGISIKFSNFHIQFGKRKVPYANEYVCQEALWLPVLFDDMNYTVLVTKPQMGNGMSVLDYIPFGQSQDREKILAGYHNPKASFRPGQMLEINYLAIWVRY